MPSMVDPKTIRIILASGEDVRGVAEPDDIEVFTNNLGEDFICLNAGKHNIFVHKEQIAAVAVRPPRSQSNEEEDNRNGNGKKRRTGRQYAGAGNNRGY